VDEAIQGVKGEETAAALTDGPMSAELVEAEAAYERFVWDNLPRNFAGHFVHGMLGMTGFRIFNAPTILPVYLHMITGSPFLVGLGQTMQQLGAVASPVVGAAAVEHRKRVLPVSMWMGTLMRVQMVAIALAAWFLRGPTLIVVVLGCLALLGLFQGAQGVAFQMLLAKVIPTKRRGLLQALRNLFGGVVAAALAWFAGVYLIGHNVLGNGYAVTFLSSAVLTSLGLTALAIIMREPEAPVVRERTRVMDRVRQFPALLAADRSYMYFMVAQTCATAGRIGVPFYALFASHVMPIAGPQGGANIGLMSVMLLGGDAASNLVWGLLGDRFGFRLTFIGCLALWIVATILLLMASAPPMVLVAFAALGAAQAGFQMSSQTMVLEFGAQADMPMRLGLSQTAQGLMNTVGPLVGGVIAVTAGYPPLFIVSIGFEAVALVLLLTVVDEPRFRRADA
jgi:MFS family permease